LRFAELGGTIQAVVDRRLHLHLDLNLEGEPVSGVVRLSEGEPLRFTGYAALIATVQSIRAERARGVAPERPRVTDSAARMP
jgi:hypothetical protein